MLFGSTASLGCTRCSWQRAAQRAAALSVVAFRFAAVITGSSSLSRDCLSYYSICLIDEILRASIQAAVLPALVFAAHQHRNRTVSGLSPQTQGGPRLERTPADSFSWSALNSRGFSVRVARCKVFFKQAGIWGITGRELMSAHRAWEAAPAAAAFAPKAGLQKTLHERADFSILSTGLAGEMAEWFKARAWRA